MTAVPPYPRPAYPAGDLAVRYPRVIEPRPASNAPVAALVVGIVTVLGGFVLFFPVLLTWLLAHWGMKEAKAGVRGGMRLAVAGNVLGWVGFVLACSFVLFQIS